MHCAGDEVKVVSTPPFAESVTEGDVKWNKGETGSRLRSTSVTWPQCQFVLVECELIINVLSECE